MDVLATLSNALKERYTVDREIGRQIGEDRDAQVRNSVENARNLIDQTFDSLELTWDGALIQSSESFSTSQ